MSLNTSDDPPPIDPQVRIGHVHLKVADLERSLRQADFYDKEVP